MAVIVRSLWWPLLVTSATLCLLPVSALQDKDGLAINIVQSVPSSCPLLETMDPDMCDISGDGVFVEGTDNTTTVPQGTMCMVNAHSDDLSVMECVDSTWIEMDYKDRTNPKFLKREKRFLKSVGNFFKSIGETIGKGINDYVFKPIVRFIFPWLKDRKSYAANKAPTIYCPTISPAFYYDKGQANKKVTWSPPRASDPEDGNILPFITSGVKPDSVLTEGSYHVTYMAGDRKGLSATCTKYFTVKAIRCPSYHTHVANGYVSCSAHTLYGSRCVYSCQAGYETSGTSSAECLSSGQWSNSKPTCKEVTCGTPKPILHGKVSCTDYTYGAECGLTCTSLGYSLKGSSSIKCQADRTWTPAGQCVDTQPPVLHCTKITAYAGPQLAKTSVFWPMPHASDNSGQPVKITSDVKPGSNFSQGTHKITFTGSDTSGLTSYCSMVVDVQVIKCNASESAPEFSNVTCSHGNVYGSECSVECHQGYTLHGDMRRECQENGTWGGTPAKCLPTPCSALPAGDKGGFHCPSGKSYQDQCSLICTEGYQVVAPVSVTCGIDGNWTASGSCIDVQAPVFPNGCPDQTAFANRLGEKTFVDFRLPDVTDTSGESVYIQAHPEPGSEFSLGNTSVLVTAVDLSGNNASCQFTITVENLTCGMPSLDPSNKLLRYNCPHKHVYGANCSLSCSDNNPVDGSAEITCDVVNKKPEWTWAGYVAPHCRSGICPKLREPKNGALACSNFLGNEGKQCIIICDENFVSPRASAAEMYICFQSNGQWNKRGYVPDCIAKQDADKTKSSFQLNFTTNACDSNIDKIKAKFLDALQKTLLKSVCNVKDRCKIENVNLTCHAGGRRKRAVELQPSKYEVVIDLNLGAAPVSDHAHDTLAYYDSLIAEINTAIKLDINNNTFSIPELGTLDSFMEAHLLFVCGLGAIFDYDNMACSACGAGFMFDNSTNSCLPCPVGTYQSEEVAFSCTPCPSGMTTRDLQAVSQQQCLTMCRPGEFSSTGVQPCHLCDRGSYQPTPGSTSCRFCPFGMTTQHAGANSDVNCLFYNIQMGQLLAQQPYLEKSQPELETFTLLIWVNLPWSYNKQSWDWSLDTDPAEDSSASITIDNVQVFFTIKTSEKRKASLRWYHMAVVQNSTTRVLYVQGEVTDNVPALPITLTGNTTIFSFLKSDSLESMVVSGVQLMKVAISEEEVQEYVQSCDRRVGTNLLMVKQVDTTLITPSTCDAVNNCEGSPCGDHGTCVDELDHFTCVCDDPWSGDRCQVVPDYCVNNMCAEGATCLSDLINQTYRCLCPDGFKGRFCQDKRVDGSWGAWNDWGYCSVTCGSGTRSRVRECDDPRPDIGGEDCHGNATEVNICQEVPCPVDGQWSEWSTWTCSRTCGRGTESRSRICNSPAPSLGGKTCLGQRNSYRICDNKGCPVHGQYGEWSSWSQCSVSCAGGVTSRSRVCDSPAPASGGAPCVESEAVQSQPCNNHSCPICTELKFEGDPDFLKCVTDKLNDMIYCNITCKLGMTLEPADLNEFKCGRLTNYTWSQQTEDNPTGILPKCTNTKIPASQTSKLNVQYDNIDCNNPPPLSGFENSISNNMEQRISCNNTQNCSSDVKATLSCGRRKRATGSIVVVLSLDFSRNDTAFDNLSDLPEAVVLAEMNRLDTIENIMEAFFNQTSEISRATVNGVEYNGEVKSAFVEVTCQEGSGFIEGVCVDCPVGSYSVGNGSCFLCGQGFYQDQSSSTSCKPCPEGLTTSGLGSSNESYCLTNPPTYNDFFGWAYVDNRTETSEELGEINRTQTLEDTSVIEEVFETTSHLEEKANGTWEVTSNLEDMLETTNELKYNTTNATSEVRQKSEPAVLFQITTQTQPSSSEAATKTANETNVTAPDNETTTNSPVGNATEISDGSFRNDFRCGETAIEVFIPAYLVPNSQLTLRDESCKLVNNGTHHVISFPYNQCGTSEIFYSQQILITNEIKVQSTLKYVDSGPVKFVTDYTIPLNCFPGGNQTVSSVLQILAPEKFQEGVLPNARFEIREYKSANYQEQITAYPVKVPLNREIYFELALTNALPNTSSSIQVSKCQATPSDNPNDRTNYLLVSNGCSASPAVQILARPTPDLFRFSSQAFQFSNANDLIYVHCYVSVCSSGQCTLPCGRPGRGRRSLRGRLQSDLVTLTSSGFQVVTE